MCVCTQSQKFCLVCLCRQLFQAKLSQTSLSAFSVPDCTSVLTFVVLLGRGYQHCHTELSPVTSVIVIEFSSSVALIWWTCSLAGWDTLSAMVQLLILPELVVPEVPRVPWVTPSYNTWIQALYFATFTTVWVIRSSLMWWQRMFHLKSFNRTQPPGFRSWHGTSVDTVSESWTCEDTAEWNSPFAQVANRVGCICKSRNQREGRYGSGIMRPLYMIHV